MNNSLDLRRTCPEISQTRISKVTLAGNSVLSIPPETSTTGDYVYLDCHGKGFNLTYEQLSRGLLLVGSTGCGKTTVFYKLLDGIIPKLKASDCMIILDSKGDYVKRYYNPKNPDHILFSTKQEHSSFTKGWNILGELADKSNALSDYSEYSAKEFADSIMKGLESPQNPFFNKAASDIIEKILISFIREARQSGECSKLTTSSICDFIASAESVQVYYNQICKHPDFKYIKGYLGDGKSNQSLGLYGFIHAAMSKLFGPIRNNMPSGSFSVKPFVRNKGGKILFLVWDTSKRESLKDIYSMFLDFAIDQAIEGLGGGNTFLVADELNIIPECSRLEDAVNFGRSKGVKTICGIQSVSQLNDSYGEHKANSILAGMLNVIAFHAVDAQTRHYISERFGKTFDVYHFGGQHFTREGYTVEDSDIINLDVGEAFVELCGVAPFKIKFKEQI